MAYNITAPGAGTVFATDDIGGIHYPRNKMAFGAEGGATDVSGASPLPVSPRMTSGGNIEVQTTSAGTDFAQFAAQPCSQLTIVNNSGTAIAFRQGAAGAALPILINRRSPCSGSQALTSSG